jgi:Fe-S cluster assembly iron-binding protein IscA
MSIDYLRGSTIDFVDDGMRNGFKIDNPNVFSCGCGNSSGTEDDPRNQSGSGGCSGCS